MTYPKDCGIIPVISLILQVAQKEVNIVITIDLRSRTPIYDQIKKQVMELILVGALKTNDQLPSVRVLASQLQINFNTVKKAFAELESEGVIYTLAGRGCFVAENALGGDGLRRRAGEAVRNAVSSARVCGLTRNEIVAVVDGVFKPPSKKP